jgi:hypothetical protein
MTVAWPTKVIEIVLVGGRGTGAASTGRVPRPSRPAAAVRKRSESTLGQTLRARLRCSKSRTRARSAAESGAIGVSVRVTAG